MASKDLNGFINQVIDFFYLQREMITSVQLMHDFFHKKKRRSSFEVVVYVLGKCWLFFRVFFHNLAANAGERESSVVEEVLHCNHFRIITEEC